MPDLPAGVRGMTPNPYGGRADYQLDGWSAETAGRCWTGSEAFPCLEDADPANRIGLCARCYTELTGHPANAPDLYDDT